MWKTEVAIKMHFAEQLFLLFVLNLREVTCSFKKMLEKIF